MRNMRQEILSEIKPKHFTQILAVLQLYHILFLVLTHTQYTAITCVTECVLSSNVASS